MPAICTARETRMWGLGRPRRYVPPPACCQGAGQTGTFQCVRVCIATLFATPDKIRVRSGSELEGTFADAQGLEAGSAQGAAGRRAERGRPVAAEKGVRVNQPGRLKRHADRAARYG